MTVPMTLLARLLVLIAVSVSILSCAARPRASENAPLPALRAGVSADYPPFAQKDDSGQFQGLAVELMRDYARDRNLRVDFQTFAWPTMVDDVVAGRVDVAASGISVRPERSVRGRYSIAFAETGTVILSKQAFQTREEMVRAIDTNATRLGVNRGGHLEHTARTLFPHANLQSFPDNRLVPEAFARGELDAVLTNNIEAPHWAEIVPGSTPFGPLTREDVALFLPPDAEERAKDLDEWLLHAERDGKLDALRMRYLPNGAASKTAEPLPALLRAIAERLSLMPFVAEAKARAGLPIEDKAQEERVMQTSLEEVRLFADAFAKEAPSEPRVQAFVSALIEAAKAVQRRPQPAVLANTYDLGRELRPALGRISSRIHRLILEIPAGLTQKAVRDSAREILVPSGLNDAESDTLADAIAQLRAVEETESKQVP